MAPSSSWSLMTWFHLLHQCEKSTGNLDRINERLHSYLGDVPPAEFEAVYAAGTVEGSKTEITVKRTLRSDPVRFRTRSGGRVSTTSSVPGCSSGSRFRLVPILAMSDPFSPERLSLEKLGSRHLHRISDTPLHPD